MEIPVIQPAQITTQSPGVSWKMSDVMPAGDYYISRDDQFYVRSLCSVAGITVQIRARILLPTGQLVTFEADHLPNSNRTLATSIIQITEGFLLDVTAFAVGATVKRGQLYVNIGLARSVAGDFTPVQSFIANYLQSPTALAFPGALQQASTDGRGVMRSITGTNPAATAEMQETVPTGARWILRALAITWVTSAVAGARSLNFTIDDGVNIYFRTNSNFTHAPSTTQLYTLSASGSAPASLAALVAALMPNDLVLSAGHRINTLSNNVQAGDDLSAPQYLVEEWLEN